MALSGQQAFWLIASLFLFAATHAGVCVVLFVLQELAPAVLFGSQSVLCLLLTASFMLIHRPATWRASSSRKVACYSPQRFDDPSEFLRGGSRLHLVDTDPDSPTSVPVAAAGRRRSGPNGPSGAAEWSTGMTWPTWLLVLNVVSTDVLWALCGVRSSWFLVLLCAIPKRGRAPLAVLGVALVGCTALFSAWQRLVIASTAATTMPLGLQVLAVDVSSTLLPSLLLLAQLAAAPAEAQQSRSSVYSHQTLSAQGSKQAMVKTTSRHSFQQDAGAPSLFSDAYRASQKKPLSYSVSGMIGSGGFSEVFLGLSHDTGELICVKQLPVGFKAVDMATMEAEVDVLRSLNHPNIVKYLGTDKGERFTILLEYVPGGSIESLLSQFGAFEEEVVKLYLRQALWGLEYLHSQGIIHHDIKGANILVSDRGQVKLTDFGCSSSARFDKESPVAMGTVLWMAPEVCRQERAAYACDIWSLGCTTLQMATNAVPWAEREFQHAIPAFFHIATCVEPPNVPEALPPPMRAFVLQCLQLEAAARPSCSQLLMLPWFALPDDDEVEGDMDRCISALPAGRGMWTRKRRPALAQTIIPQLSAPEAGAGPAQDVPDAAGAPPDNASLPRTDSAASGGPGPSGAQSPSVVVVSPGRDGGSPRPAPGPGAHWNARQVSAEVVSPRLHWTPSTVVMMDRQHSEFMRQPSAFREAQVISPRLHWTPSTVVMMDRQHSEFMRQPSALRESPARGAATASHTGRSPPVADLLRANSAVGASVSPNVGPRQVTEFLRVSSSYSPRPARATGAPAAGTGSSLNGRQMTEFLRAISTLSNDDASEFNHQLQYLHSQAEATISGAAWHAPLPGAMPDTSVWPVQPMVVQNVHEEELDTMV